MATTKRKVSLKAHCEQLAQEFSPLLAARHRAAKARKIMDGNTGYKFRLMQLVSMDCRDGQVYPALDSTVPTLNTIAWIPDTDIGNQCEQILNFYPQ